MATRFYFQSEGTPYITPTGWWHQWDATGVRTPLPLVDSTSKVNTPHASGIVASPFVGGDATISIGQWVSPALSGQIISGTASGTMRCGQIDLSINSYLAISMYLVDRNGNLRSTLFTGTGIESANSPVSDSITTLQQEKFTNINKDLSLTLAPTTVYNGDSLIVEIGYRENAGSTGSVHIYYGTMDGVEDFPTHSGTLVPTHVPWISFSHDFSFYNPTLTTDLISYWGMNELAGGAIDYHGYNTLLESGGTIGEIAGKLDGCRTFAATDTEWFEAKDNSDLSTGDIDFTFAGWAYSHDLTTYAHPVIANKGWNNTLDNSEWILYYDTGLNRFAFSVAQDSNSITLPANNLDSVLINTWYFIVGWHDSVNDKIGISVNDIPPNITGYPSGITNGNRPFQIGASTSQSFYWDGRIDDCAFWKRVLSREEILNLYYSASGRNYEYIVGNSGHDLTRNLISYWPLDEESGNAIDVHGSNTLTDNNTVGTGVGKVSGARDFKESNSEYFSIADNPSLSADDNDICMCAWLYFESLPTQAFPISKTTTVNTSDSEYLIQLFDTNLYFTVVDTAQTNFFSARAINFGIPNTGTWYFVCGWHDAANDTLNIEINNQYIDSISYHAGIADTNAQFNIGGTVRYWDGLIDEVGFWKRNLNGYERKLLYNNGIGRNYAYISSGVLIQSILIIPKIKIIGGIPYFAINKGVW